jgi:hypothetical protein
VPAGALVLLTALRASPASQPAEVTLMLDVGSLDKTTAADVGARMPEIAKRLELVVR